MSWRRIVSLLLRPIFIPITPAFPASSASWPPDHPRWVQNKSPFTSSSTNSGSATELAARMGSPAAIASMDGQTLKLRSASPDVYVGQGVKTVQVFVGNEPGKDARPHRG